MTRKITTLSRWRVHGGNQNKITKTLVRTTRFEQRRRSKARLGSVLSPTTQIRHYGTTRFPEVVPKLRHLSQPSGQAQRSCHPIEQRCADGLWQRLMVSSKRLH